MIKTVEQYKARFGYYTKEVLADNIYCNRTNRAKLKRVGISPGGQGTGKITGSVKSHKTRTNNPIEGMFGQAQNSIHIKPDKSEAGTNKQFMDCYHHYGTEPG